jgi:hypothetical protein
MDSKTAYSLRKGFKGFNKVDYGKLYIQYYGLEEEISRILSGLKGINHSTHKALESFLKKNDRTEHYNEWKDRYKKLERLI